MTMTNQERADRCREAINAYTDDDTYTNLVDFLADAMHWCHLHGHSFSDILETALTHFHAETVGDDILHDLNHEVTNERSEP